MESLLTYFLLGAALFVALVLLLPVISFVPFLEFPARFFVALITLMACSLYGTLASIVLRICGYGGISQWATARSFKWTMRFTTGVRFVVQNEDILWNTRPAVLVGNHQTELDILMLGAVFPKYCSVTAKKSLKWMPLLGWFMALSKTVFIDRGNREHARAAFDGAAKQIRNDRQSVWIFPEGTRSYTAQADMLPFKKGAFHLAVQAQVPIIPVVVANYSNVLHFQSRHFTAGNVPVKVLDPIPTEGMTAEDVNKLCNETREKMLDELVKLTELARGQAVAVPLDKAKQLDKNSNAGRRKSRKSHDL